MPIHCKPSVDVGRETAKWRKTHGATEQGPAVSSVGEPDCHGRRASLHDVRFNCTQGFIDGCAIKSKCRQFLVAEFIGREENEVRVVLRTRRQPLCQRATRRALAVVDQDCF